MFAIIADAYNKPYIYDNPEYHKKLTGVMFILITIMVFSVLFGYERKIEKDVERTRCAVFPVKHRHEFYLVGDSQKFKCRHEKKTEGSRERYRVHA